MNDSENILALSYLRKESLDIYNRLHSIAQDVKFVKHVHQAYPNIPLLPNLRCGSWYTDPYISYPAPAYFKSTDGHFSNWNFNLRRPNLHLLPLLTAHNGMIIVDSTRTGKRIPDALSKTLPIWCAVINRAVSKLHPDMPLDSWSTRLYTPPNAVSPQEHAQIETKLDAWADALLASSYDIPRLPRPLRPIWITPATTVFPSLEAEAGFIPILCVSASKHLASGEDRRSNAGFVYVQGSGDDHELWGMGLTPSLFWENQEALLSAERSELESLVCSLVLASKTAPTTASGNITSITKVNGRVLVASISDLVLPNPNNDTSDIKHILITSGDVPNDEHTGAVNQPIVIRTAAGKKGQLHFLQTVIPEVLSHAGNILRKDQKLCIACDTGRDLGIGVATAILQCFFDDAGKYISLQIDQVALPRTKQTIQTRLQWIISSRPEANPSRTTLKRVNEYLLSPSAFRDYPSNALVS